MQEHAKQTMARSAGAGATACLALMVTGLVSLQAPQARAQWTQWGGPHQDFKAPAGPLADSWPESGPKKLWKRDLGDGYSAIIVDGDRLYTMARIDGKEVVVCLSAKDGSDIWRTPYKASPKPDHVTQFGEGPRSTPLLVDGKLYTIGVSGKMNCLRTEDGKILWSHDLWDDFEGTFLNHGYASSAFSYKNLIITMVGGTGHAFVAFDKDSGRVVWKKLDYGNSYSTPKLINVDGQDQLACFMATGLIGIDPTTGEKLWEVDHSNQWRQNVCMPIWGDDNHLVFSSPEAGTRGYRLTRKNGKTELEELWHTRKIRFYHTTAIRIGDWVYGSSGERSPCFYTAINVKTGKIAWRKRGLAKATSVFADGKFIILDEEGTLALAKASPDEFKILSQVPVLGRVAWTVPTLVGKTLFLRDKKSIMALDLG